MLKYNKKTFQDIQNYFMNLYKGNKRHQGIAFNTHILPLLHLDDKLVIKSHHPYLILKADINLKYFRSIQRNNTQNISLRTIIDHGYHTIYGTLEEIQHSYLGKTIKEACKRLSYMQGRYKILIFI